MSKTAVEDIYGQYEKWRSLPTKEEHAQHFLAWFLAYKEENLEKEEQQIIEAWDDGWDAMVNSGFDVGKDYFKNKYNK